MDRPAWADPDAVQQEVDVLEAMYPDELCLKSWPPVLSLTFQGWATKIELPETYPDILPTLHIEPPVPVCEPADLDVMAATVLSQLAAGGPLLVDLAQAVADEISSKHSMVQSILAEQESIQEEEQLRLRELEDRQMAHNLAQRERNRAVQENAATANKQEEERLPRFDFSHAGIRTGEPITDRKSTFLAFLWPVTSREDVNFGLATLKGNGKIARAAHNMLAWRLVSPATGSLVSECDSDGEGGAGGGLHQLLHNTGVENVAVLVTRWYGGIHLGPDRFKHINNCARALLAQEGYIVEGKKAGKRK